MPIQVRERPAPSAPGVTLSRRPGEPPDTDEEDVDLDSLPEAGIDELDLDDPGKFVKFARVPVMDTHGTIFGRDQIKKPISWKTLRLMAENTNDLIERRGQYPAIIIGHTHDDGEGPNAKVPESAQPVHVGFSKNYVLGRYKGEPCLLADLHIRKPLVGMALTFPHRSPELFRSKDPDQNLVDAIALLRRAPERPLGLLTYGRSIPPGAELVRYARDFPPLRPADTAAVFQSGRMGPKPGKAAKMALDATNIQAIVHGVTRGLAAHFKDLEEGEHEIEGGEHEMEDELSDVEGEEEEIEDAEEGEEEEPESYASTTAGPTSAYVPGMGGRRRLERSRGRRRHSRYAEDAEHEGDEEEIEEIHHPAHENPATMMRQGRIGGAGMGDGGNNPPVERTRERMSRTSARAERVRYSRDLAVRDRENEVLRKRVGQLERYARAAERGADLQALIAEGYDLDIEEELNDCVDLPPKKYGRFLQKIMARYQRDPIDRPAIEPAHNENEIGDPNADAMGLTADHSIEMARYAREHPEMAPNEAVNDWLKKFNAKFRQGGPRVA